MQVVLVMFRSGGERRSFSVTRDVTVIGRREDCDLRIPVGEVSRKHCRILRDGDTLRIEDLGSSNGTYHNGQRVQNAELSPGDSLQVGPVVFVVQIDGAPADEELQPFTSQAAANLDDSVADNVRARGDNADDSVAEANVGAAGDADELELLGAMDNTEAEPLNLDDMDLDEITGVSKGEGSDIDMDVDEKRKR
jgi:pSer/pThr/pTyr-binding forkhead associated (FHA) protein